MATKETIWGSVQLMAGAWKFPGVDLKQTAVAYYEALRDLSDEDIERATRALLASWTKQTAPSPAVLRQTADELRPAPACLPRPARREPTHDEIMAKLRRDTYHVKAIRECGLADERLDRWEPKHRRAVSQRQHELREQLGIAHPDPQKAKLRPAWGATQ